VPPLVLLCLGPAIARTAQFAGLSTARMLVTACPTGGPSHDTMLLLLLPSKQAAHPRPHLGNRKSSPPWLRRVLCMGPVSRSLKRWNRPTQVLAGALNQSLNPVNRR
jgi:hypothetical protein